MFPIGILNKILNYLEPKNPRSFHTYEFALKMYKFCDDFSFITKYDELAKKYKEILYYLNTYTQYTTSYEAYQGSSWGNEITDYGGHPILLDMMTTGICLPYIKPSKDWWRDEMTEEVARIIDLFPGCVNNNMGFARCRNSLTPLYFAIHNDDIPTSIIELLIRKGADKNHMILINGQEVPMINDFGMGTSLYRLEEVKRLLVFEKCFDMKV